MISIIIPTYNEADVIEKTIQSIREKGNEKHIAEIIVSDGGSQDDTVSKAQAYGAIAVRSPKKGRSAQMNFGASLAGAPILYFLHADTLPPENFTQAIIKTGNKGYVSGCFTLSFDHQHWFLKANCWFTRFNINAVRFGDQSLFVRKEVFEQSGGFREDHVVLEDQEIINRLKKQGKFAVMKNPVVTSARKYVVNGIYKTQGIFFLIYFMYQLGYSQHKLVSTYRKLIRQDKI